MTLQKKALKGRGTLNINYTKAFRVVLLNYRRRLKPPKLLPLRENELVDDERNEDTDGAAGLAATVKGCDTRGAGATTGAGWLFTITVLLTTVV